MTDIPGKMKAAIFRALAKKPEERQSTVREFFEELSSGGARLKTGVMSPHEGSRESSVGSSSAPKTEMGVAAAAAFAPPSYVPAGPPPVAQAAPPYTPPPPAAPMGGGKQGGGSNTGLIAAAVVVGLIVVAAVIGIIVKVSKPAGDPNVTLTVPSGGVTAATATPPGRNPGR